MRQFLLFLAALIVAAAPAIAQSNVAAESGAPLYTISVTRGGTPLGDIKIELWPDIAPLHVANFDSLVSIGFYNGLAFHRIAPGFVIQGGDPNTRDQPEDTWGIGDPDQTNVPAEFSKLSHVRGIISQARKGNDINSGTSQFFICVANVTQLDGKYSIYGRVVQGMDVVDTIVRSPQKSPERPAEKIVMTIVRTGTNESVPAAPALTYPSTDTTRVTEKLTIRWAPVDGAILYEAQVSASPDFATLVFKDSMRTTSVLVPKLMLGENKYYWRVRASNGGIRGPFSEVRVFTTGASLSTVPQELENTSGIGLELLRQDAGSAELSISLQRRDRVMLTLVDVTGREQVVLPSTEWEAGRHTLNIETGGLAPGVYLCNVQVGAASRSLKLIVTPR